MTIPTITALPAAPSRTSPSTFAAVGDTFVAALPGMVTEINAFSTAINATGYLTMVRRAISVADTAIASDSGKHLVCTGAFTLSASASATLGNGWWCYVSNSGTGNITIDPNAAETVDGQTTGILYPGFVMLLQCNGSALFATKVAGSRTEVLTSGTSWVCPMGVRAVNGRGCGAGGGGGRGSSGNQVYGGSAGGYAEWYFSSAPGTAYSFVIGAGGSAGASNGSAGSNGTGSSFNTGVLTVDMFGGTGGANSAAAGGTSGGVSINGALNIQGGSAILNSVSVGGNTPFGVGGAQFAPASGYGSGGYGSSTGQPADPGRQGVIILEY